MIIWFFTSPNGLNIIVVLFRQSPKITDNFPFAKPFKVIQPTANEKNSPLRRGDILRNKMAG